MSLYSGVDAYPVAAKLFENSVSVSDTEDLITIDSNDWLGSLQGDFSNNRPFGFPLVDIACKVRTGDGVNVQLLYRDPVVPVNDAAPTFLTSVLVAQAGAGPGQWAELTYRLTARFSLVRLERVGATDPMTAYCSVFVRST